LFPEKNGPPSRVPALHSAASRGTTEVVDYLLDLKPELSDEVTCDHLSALHVAAAGARREAFLRLLARNPRSIDVVSSTNRNTLHFAATGGDPQVLEAVLSLRPELACGVDSQGDTALHCLFIHQRENELEPYLERIWQSHPPALQAMNKYGDTPFMRSAYREYNWGTEFFKRKLSWDEIIQAHEELQSCRLSSASGSNQVRNPRAASQCSHCPVQLRDAKQSCCWGF